MRKIFLLNLIINKNSKKLRQMLTYTIKAEILAFGKHVNICIQSFVKSTIESNLTYL